MQMSSGTQQQQQLLGCVLSFLNRPKLNAWIKSLVHLPFPPANAIAVSCGFFITRPPPPPWQRGNVAALKWKFVILPLIYANTPRVHFFKRKNEIAPFVDIDRPHNNNNNCGIINICCCQFTILKERKEGTRIALPLALKLNWVELSIIICASFRWSSEFDTTTWTCWHRPPPFPHRCRLTSTRRARDGGEDSDLCHESSRVLTLK